MGGRAVGANKNGAKHRLFDVITWFDKLNSRRSNEILLNDFITSALQWMLLLRPTRVSAVNPASSSGYVIQFYTKVQ